MHSTQRTQHIELNTRLCEACRRCVEACRDGALGMVSLPFHKHARIRDAGLCRGCLRCVRACEPGAIQALRPRSPRREPGARGAQRTDPDPAVG